MTYKLIKVGRYCSNKQTKPFNSRNCLKNERTSSRDLFFGGLLILSVLLAIRDVNNLLASDQVEWVFVFTGVGLGCHAPN